MGGKRKILVPPRLGWATSGGFPQPATYSGKRKLLNHQEENLLFEVEVVRVKKRTPAVEATVVDVPPPTPSSS